MKRQSRLTRMPPGITRTRPLPRPPMDCALGLCIRGLPRLIGESARPRREPRSPGRRACPVYASLLFSPDECCPRPRPDACGVSAGQNLPAFRRQYIASPELRLVLEPPVFSICVGIAQNPVIPAFAGMTVDRGNSALPTHVENAIPDYSRLPGLPFLEEQKGISAGCRSV